jgi:DNA-binding MarR family transcriptional regulator
MTPIPAPIGQAIRLLQQKQSRVLDLGQRYGLTRPQFSVLSAVVGLPGADQIAVSRNTFIDTSTVAMVVDRLAARKLISISRNPNDRRRDRLEPSRDAIALVYEVSPELLGANARILSALAPAERSEFMRLLALTAFVDRTVTPFEGYVMPSPDNSAPPLDVGSGLGRLLRGSLQRYGQIWATSVENVTFVQYIALRAISQAPRLDQRQLGEVISVDKASLTEVLKRLERRTLIRKEAHPRDGRRRTLHLTAAGQDVERTARDRAADVDKLFLKPLSDTERRTFGFDLDQLVGAQADESD